MEKEEYNEYLTRRKLIDVFLKEQGWDVSDPGKILSEVDTLQSEFLAKRYKLYKDTCENQEASRYADYLLLDSNGDPLAIIEAKRTSKDPISGKKQAEQYATHIKNQTGKEVFIFLSNGYEIWFWNWSTEGLRLVKGFHSRDALERIRFQNAAGEPFDQVPIKAEIINRPYQIEAVNRVLEGIDRKKRKFLLVMATGTGKTRVSMALIDVLIRSKRVQKVLFLADRKILRDQAYTDGFQAFLPSESRDKIFSGKIDKNKRLYVATIQTMMECYREFSPGDFDLIISDEAHRSIYNKWKDVFTYFDAIQVGLTATPSDLIDRDTFRFFECLDEKGHPLPTAYYGYDDAIREKYLVNFKVTGANTHFQIAGIQSGDIPDSVKKKLFEEGLDEEELNWEGTEIEKAVSVTGTNEAIVREFMENCITDKGGTLPAKTIIFAISKKHAKRIWEAFEKLYPEYGGRLADIIVSENSRALDIKEDFKKQEFPRIAISVDMLDTGVDIPEVCNLVFAKPVFSRIKFWQMIGRGTRANAACTHFDWLPEGKKEEFLIFDFWNNFEFFKMKPEGKEVAPAEALPSKIFRIRLDALAHFKVLNDETQIAATKQRLHEDIARLPKDSVAIRERIRDVEMAESEKLWDNIGVDPLEFLKLKMMPLMRYQQDINLNIASFTLKCERLGLAILRGDAKTVEALKGDIGEWLQCLPRTLQQVKDKEELLDKVLSKAFWEHISYNDAMLLLFEFAPLMAYKRAEPRAQVILDISDVVQQRTLIEFGPDGQQEYAEAYRDKVEKLVKTLAAQNPTIRKIEADKVLNEEDLTQLETTLNSPDLFVTEENLQKAYAQHKGTLVQFIKKILGLYEFPDPEHQIAEEFKTFMIERNQFLNASQVNFLRALQSVLVKKKHIEYKDLFDRPFTNIPNAPTPLFSEDTLKEMVGLCHRLEQEVL